MHIDRENGLLVGAEYSHSPNFDERPSDCDIDLLVIHGISLPPGEFGSDDVIAFFNNSLDATKHPYFETIVEMKVSSHLFIRRDGKIWQFVPFHRRAWHAGQSQFQSRKNCNDFAVGIELEGTDTLAYTLLQYQQLALVTVALMQAYPGITLERIVGHSEIAPQRKTDPGQAFDWDLFRHLVSKEILVDQQKSQRANGIT
ncbi:MAG TPA: 1,6-anhydro-N-acetylmuramyl-L-alanine amidase AmpD [Candidatus Berkiella sp.]|nr:1,6-anhydro-N-acetylmuramyl-L-alanine amidase AmpD [Candidatus Berkiella sp.]